MTHNNSTWLKTLRSLRVQREPTKSQSHFKSDEAEGEPAGVGCVLDPTHLIQMVKSHLLSLVDVNKPHYNNFYGILKEASKRPTKPRKATK